MIPLPPELTEIFEGLVVGETIKEAARRRNKSPRTVEQQRREIFERYEVSSHIQLLARLLREARSAAPPAPPTFEDPVRQQGFAASSARPAWPLLPGK